MNLTCEKQPGVNSVRRSLYRRKQCFKRLSRSIENFLNPRFTTTDFDSSRTVIRAKHEIKSCEYEIRNTPKLALGTVNRIVDGVDVTVWVRWNEYGKCRSMLGQRLRDYDLVRPNEREIFHAMMMGEAMVLSVVMILICLLGN
jgi:hypothetical protein